MEIIPIRGLHYKLPVLGFRIGGIAYLTDFNYIPPKEFDKLKGVDTLVINALRKEAHISHFTLGEALHVSHLVSPRQTYLTHISHQMGRQAQEEPALPETSVSHTTDSASKRPDGQTRTPYSTHRKQVYDTSRLISATTLH